jgi:3D-(3,5/4)-trihydroxycyclohexane-1,2-dione acylhydrolase (decyclizing)
MVVIFDNRRMAAITGLQRAQYGQEFKTNDAVAVDYVQLAGAVRGVKALFGGHSASELTAALDEAYRHESLSVVHVPVYAGEDPLGGLGAWGQWNVGNWCEDVQKAWLAQDL